MGKKKTDVAEETTVDVAADHVTVEWRGQSREYSREIHGEAYHKLATEFAEKVGGQVV